MSVGPVSAWPDQANATRLPSGDNAGGPSPPGYEASGRSWIGAITGLGSKRQTSAATITTTANALTAILVRRRCGTSGVLTAGGICCSPGGTTVSAAYVDAG